MKTILVNYATDDFLGSQELLNISAIRYGIDYIVSWSASSLYARYPEFYQECRAILNARRGAGYWLWKPFIILEAMSKADEGDIVVYFDAGIEVIEDLNPLLEICKNSKEGILLFATSGQINKVWTKRDCFVLMGCDEEKYWDALQVSGGFQLYRKNKESWNFVSECLQYCKNFNIITDAPNICGVGNLPEFRDHRHDQSVLSLLAEKYNIERYRDPSQWGNHEKVPQLRQEGEWLAIDYVENDYKNSSYSTLLNLHRKGVRIM